MLKAGKCSLVVTVSTTSAGKQVSSKVNVTVTVK